MPVNFLEIRSQVTEMGAQAKKYHQRHNELVDQANALLQSYSAHTDLLSKRVDRILEVNSRLRCAIPEHEILTYSRTNQVLAEKYTILAADGSQINPSWHDAFPFCVINIGAIRIQPNQQLTPEEITRSKLLYYDTILTAQGLLSEADVALQRDLDERWLMSELADGLAGPVIAFTDGPLELYYESLESATYRKALSSYIISLKKLHDLQVASAGYVDKPLSDLVVRLLELATLAESDFGQAGKQRPLFGVMDAELFYTILEPGDRSAVFAIQSYQAQRFENELALHFFYLNVGRNNHPAIARVEIPAWVARSERLLDLLHGALIDQCRKMGMQPYPYALHRAHEIALVSFDEKARIMDMLAHENARQGFEFGAASPKQSNKDLPTSRTRHKI